MLVAGYEPDEWVPFDEAVDPVVDPMHTPRKVAAADVQIENGAPLVRRRVVNVVYEHIVEEHALPQYPFVSLPAAHNICGVIWTVRWHLDSKMIP